ncbi:MAG: hypothetical protein ACFNT8_07020 [Prevotella sp.]
MNTKTRTVACTGRMRPKASFFLHIILALAFVSPAPKAWAGSKVSAANARQARELFNKVYQMTFGPQGSRLSYSVNIIGLYKTNGTIWMKGKKMHYVEPRYCSWCDGTYLYRVDQKKHTVELHNPSSPKRDKYLSRFTFDVNMFDYSWNNSPEGIVINLDAKDGAKGIKHARVILDRTTHTPQSLKLKVAFFWTTVKISGYHSGDINDNVFIFPAAKYKSFEFTNMWPD